MDYIITLLADLTNTSTTAGARWLFMAMVGISAIALIGSLLMLLWGLMDPVKRRLNAIGMQQHQQKKRGSKMEDSLDSISHLITPKDDKEREGVQTLLTHAGYYSKSAMPAFYAIKILLALIGGAGTLIVTRYLPDLSSQEVLFYCVLIMTIFLFLPNYVLRHLGSKRQRKLRNAFPDALDLLVVSTEAGLGFIAAFNRVANELSLVAPELGDEMTLVCSKLRVGVTPIDALKQMVGRTGLYEIRGLVGVIGQSMKLGANLADTLRDYSEEFRDKRMQKAEEQAAKLGTKMIFPLVTCMWPGFFAVAVGPALVAVFAAFKG